LKRQKMRKFRIGSETHSLGLRKRRWREDKKEDVVCLQPDSRELESSPARARVREERHMTEREWEETGEMWCDVATIEAARIGGHTTAVCGHSCARKESAQHRACEPQRDCKCAQQRHQQPSGSSLFSHEWSWCIHLSIYLSSWYIEMLLLSFLFLLLKKLFQDVCFPLLWWWWWWSLTDSLIDCVTTKQTDMFVCLFVCL
jgi:hypothetical protein